MNKLFDEDLEKVLQEEERIKELVEQVEKDSSLLDTLPLSDLVQILDYYEKRIKEKEQTLANLLKKTGK